MARESKKSKRERAAEVCRRMEERYGQVGSALDYHSPYTLLIAVMLSAQTTARSVNKVTPELFRRWPGPAELAAADVAEVEDVIHSLGFYHSKARHAVELARTLVADYGGEVPSTMEGLTSLPGVGRKTANIVLNKAFGIVEGIAVDTHVYRIATRLGFTRAPSPAAAEKDLLDLIPHDLWTGVNETWIRLGREICPSQRPKCDECPLADLCPSAGNPDRYRKRSKK